MKLTKLYAVVAPHADYPNEFPEQLHKIAPHPDRGGTVFIPVSGEELIKMAANRATGVKRWVVQPRRAVCVDPRRGS